MIVVKADLLSAISSGRDRTLCEVEIANTGEQGIGSRGTYEVRLYSASRTGKRGRLIRTARVEDWPREAKPAWRLIQAAMEALG
jgi:hypothetical protein